MLLINSLITEEEKINRYLFFGCTQLKFIDIDSTELAILAHFVLILVAKIIKFIIKCGKLKLCQFRTVIKTIDKTQNGESK